MAVVLDMPIPKIPGELSIRRFNPFEDYEDVCSWWRAHKWVPMTLENLPKLGFIAVSEKEKLSCVWLYQTDARMAWLDWLISNPNADNEDRRKSLDLVIKRCLIWAKDLGYKTIFTSVQHEGLMKRYVNMGFIPTDRGITNMIRPLEVEI